jgi:hypothetical protein
MNEEVLRAMPGMHNVRSSYIAAVGYDPDAKELHVRLAKQPETHVYEDVDQSVYDRLLISDSKGAYVNAVLRPNHKRRVL